MNSHILVECPEKSYGIRQNSTYDNKILFGNNIIALKALENDFTGKIKCVYIDPPFNTGRIFEHYNDGCKQSVWINLMTERLKSIRNLMSEEGMIFLHIDDNELASLMLVCDEIFGTDNRCSVITFKQGSATGHKVINRGCVNTTNFILLYCKNKHKFFPNRVFTRRNERNKRYDKFILNREKHFSEWKIITLRQAVVDYYGLASHPVGKKTFDYDDKLNDFVLDHSESLIRTARPNYSAVGSEVRKKIDQSRNNQDSIYYLKRENFSDFYLINGQRILFYSDRFANVDGETVQAQPLTTIWDDLLSNNLHNEGQVNFSKGKKPENLIKRILQLSTNEGEWVLDSFAGSGTTGAVAHKMHRRWIMIESGDQCDTHIVPRLKRVIKGEDSSGISKVVNWKGGGSFSYYEVREI